MEKRRNRRFAKRFKVRFGEKDFTLSGFSSDISSTGMFVATASVLNLGMRIHLEVTMETNHKVFFEGVVARLNMVAPELRQLIKGGFGVRFLSGAELMGEMIPHLKDKARIVLSYATRQGFESAYENELKRGGCFVWTTAQHPINSVLHLEIEAEFASQSVAFECKVVHVVAGQDGRFGTALMFVDQGAAVAGLSALIGK
jgi:Tfp pilus assembly protein PilZ